MTDTVTLPRSVVEQALAALFMYKPMVTGVTFQHGLDAMQELRAALEQPQVEQEPAPNGATHRQPKQGAFYKRVDGKWYVWSRMENGEPHRWYISPGTSESCLEPLNAAAPQPPVVEQPPVEQEPVAYFYTRSGRVVSTEATDALMQQMIGESGRVALYAHPQPPRQPLTNEEIFDAIRPLCNNDTNCHAIIGLSIDEYRAIEKAIWKKNS